MILRTLLDTGAVSRGLIAGERGLVLTNDDAVTELVTEATTELNGLVTAAATPIDETFFSVTGEPDTTDGSLSLVNDGATRAIKLYSTSSALLTLTIASAGLTALNTLSNTRLTSLIANDNQLTAFDYSANTALTYVDLSNNSFTSAVIDALIISAASNLLSLTRLILVGNAIPTIASAAALATLIARDCDVTTE